MTDASRPDPVRRRVILTLEVPYLMPDQPDFTIEAYGTVTPPPDPESDNDTDGDDETEDED